MKNKVKTIISKYKTIISNTFYLSIVKLITLIMPFIALPYIIKTVGAKNYGIIVFAQSIIAYFSIFVNFGMDVSAVRDVSVARNNKKELSRIVSSVLMSKLLLLVVAFLVLLGITFTIPLFIEIRLVLFFAFITCLSEVVLPIWYYQGIEKMKYMTLIQTSAVVFYTITIFLFIKESSDYILVPLLQSCSVLFSGLVCLFLLFFNERVKLKIPTIKSVRRTIAESTPFFMSRVSFVLNTNIAKTMSGILLTMDVVAALDLAQKLSGFVAQPIQMLNQAIFPFNAQQRDKKNVKFFLYIIGVCAVILSFSLYWLAPILVNYFAKGAMPAAITYTRILCFYVFCFAFSTYLGSPVLVAFNKNRPFNMSVIYSTFVMLFIYTIIYAFDMASGLSFASVMIATELFIVIYRYYFCKKYEIL